MAPRVPSHSPSNQLETQRLSNEQKRRKVSPKRNTSAPQTTSSRVSASAAVNSAFDATNPSPHNPSALSPYPYGNMYGMGGYNAYGGGMMFGSPYYSMMQGAGGGGPLSGLNQFLFGFQSVIMSLGQAVQIIGMNTQALKQLFESVSTMFDHALSTWNDMQALEAASRRQESPEAKKRRRQIRALRWAMVVGLTYATYRLIRRVLKATDNRKTLLPPLVPQHHTLQQYNAGSPMYYHNNGRANYY